MFLKKISDFEENFVFDIIIFFFLKNQNNVQSSPLKSELSDSQ